MVAAILRNVQVADRLLYWAGDADSRSGWRSRRTEPFADERLPARRVAATELKGTSVGAESFQTRQFGTEEWPAFRVVREPVVIRMYDVAAESLLHGIHWGLLWMAALARQLHCILNPVASPIRMWVVADSRSMRWAALSRHEAAQRARQQG